LSRLALKSRAEVIKLAYLLGEPTDRLDYLERLDPDGLRVLRERATDAQYDADRDRFQRLAFASRLLPLTLAALIAENVFGALLCARITAALDTQHAIDLADRLPAGFLADLAIRLDPRRASAIIAGMPPEQIAEVAEILNRRQEYVTMGRFVGHMTDEAIRDCLAVLEEPDLLRISYVLEGDEGLERVIGLMSRERLRRAIRAATDEDLWPEALDLLGRVSAGLAGKLGELAAQAEDRHLDAMVRTAQEDQLWDAVLPVMRTMSDDGRRRFAQLPSIHQRDVLAAIVRSAVGGDTWRDLLPLVPLLPREAQVRVWSEVVAMGETLTPERLQELAVQALDLELDHMLSDVIAAGAAADLWRPALGLLAALGPDLQRRLVPFAWVLSDDRRVEAASHARELDLLSRLGPLADVLARS
jgi:hypothetical protein